MTQVLCGQNARQKGDQAWNIGKYKTAVNNYSKVKNISKDKQLLAKRGLGYFKLNQLTRAINDFTLSKKLGNDDPELFFLMAQTKHHLNEYEEAAFFYKQYVKEAGDKSSNAKLAIREIKNCAYAAFHKNDNSTAFVESFGEEINSYYDEIYSIQSQTFGNSFYFSSNRNLADNDVFAYSLDEKGNWEEEKSLTKGINSKADEYVMDVSTDGRSMLYISKAGLIEDHHIYVSTWDQNDKQHIIELPQNLLLGAVDLQLVDRNTIAFASKELKGMGGYDIFVLNYENGRWSNPIHQGDVINSEYDDRSPFFASTKQFVYFSSNRPYCYGGFDTYYYNTIGMKDEPTNMGLPLNSSGNDLHFRLSQDGQMALLSSDRKTGEGAYDIYQVFMQNFKPMPAPDTAQLEYVQDYLHTLDRRENPKTHLDKLKEKIDSKEEITAEEDRKKEAEEKRKLEEEAASLAALEDARIKAEQAAKEEEDRAKKLEQEIAEQEKLKKEKAEKEEKLREAAKKRAEEKAAAKEARLAAKEKERKDKEIAEQAIQEQKKKEAAKLALAEQKDKETKLAKEQKEAADKLAQAEQKERERTQAKANKTSRTQVSNLPQKESGESPLSSIVEAVEKESSIKVETISGENIANSLLYQDRHDLQNGVNKEKLDKLVKYLTKNKEHKVHLIAHTDHLELGLEEYMQYNTLKRANHVARYILEKNISEDRISIESVMSNYPIAKEQVGGQTNEKYLAYNKRIDFEIRDADNFVLTSIDISDMKIPGYAQDRRYELFSQIREEVYYSVQIASTKQIFKNAVLRIYDDIYIRKATPLSNNNYYIGVYNKFEDAVVLQENLKDSSAPFSKIVAFYNGKPIEKSELSKLVKDYPDLKNFIAESSK